MELVIKNLNKLANSYVFYNKYISIKYLDLNMKPLFHSDRFFKKATVADIILYIKNKIRVFNTNKKLMGNGESETGLIGYYSAHGPVPSDLSIIFYRK